MRSCTRCGQAGHNIRSCNSKPKQDNSWFDGGVDKELVKQIVTIQERHKERDRHIEEEVSFNPHVGQWLISNKTGKIAGKIKQISKDTISYDSMLGAFTESKITDIVNSGYFAADLEPSMIINHMKRESMKP